MMKSKLMMKYYSFFIRVKKYRETMDCISPKLPSDQLSQCGIITVLDADGDNWYAAIISRWAVHV